MKLLLISAFLCLMINFGFGQTTELPCSQNSIISRHLQINANAVEESLKTEQALQRIIEERRALPQERSRSSFVIPVVMHVFHNGDEGRMDTEQALSGLEILNDDFNGRNDGWNSIDDEFDPIKGTLDITFCLATIDPQGAPTTGIIYHEDEAAVYNQGNLFQYAWDNYKYLNIYFPKYTQGEPSDFTGYAYLPSTINTSVNRDGIFYSSIRWGYGTHSELEEGDDWASVCSHEVGHWLNLRHTFEGGCQGAGDFVDDTPPTLGGTIELENCDNYDFSCNVHTNGENFMDYNHRCKKMFTQGQIERVTAALFLPSRINLWSEENLIETGCSDFFTSSEEIDFKKDVVIYPNPSSKYIIFKIENHSANLNIFNSSGQLMNSYALKRNENQINLHDYVEGVYFFSIVTKEGVNTGKFMVSNQ